MRHYPSSDNDSYLWYEEVSKGNLHIPFFPSKEHFEDKFFFVAFNRKRTAYQSDDKEWPLNR